MLAKKGQVVKTMKQRYFALIGQSLSYYAVEEDVFREDGKYSSEESVHRVYGSTVVDISIPPPSFKPLSLYF